MAIDKKLAQKAEGERYLKLETGILEVKRQEIAEMERMKNKMVNMIKEIVLPLSVPGLVCVKLVAMFLDEAQQLPLLVSVNVLIWTVC